MIPLRERQFRELAALAASEAGLHMPPSKQDFVASRLQRRLRQLGCPDFETYVDVLHSSAGDPGGERASFVSALTTNVTHAFREAHHFMLLREHLRAHRSTSGAKQRPYRIWSAGCSSGEEPLSIATICFAEFGPGWQAMAEILATDVDAAVLASARNRDDTEVLGAALLEAVPQTRHIARARPRDPAGFCQRLNAGIRYLRHNLLDDLPDARTFDTIFCRNVTIYFERRAQCLVQQRLAARLEPGGLLMIGHSERLALEGPDLSPAGRTAYRKAIASIGQMPPIRERTCR